MLKNIAAICKLLNTLSRLSLFWFKCVIIYYQLILKMRQPKNFHKNRFILQLIYH